MDSDLQARGEPPKALSPTLSMESQLVHLFSEASQRVMAFRELGTSVTADLSGQGPSYFLSD